MQGEFAVQYPDLEIAILGVNEAGRESGNEAMCEGRDIPWLQDTDAANWWGRWSPTYRDVILVDGEGELVTTYNLTTNSLLEEDNYVELKALIVETAEGI